jgi:hypothetical protein
VKLMRVGQPGAKRPAAVDADGTDLFHVIDCEDYAAMLAALRDDPVNVVCVLRRNGLG